MRERYEAGDFRWFDPPQKMIAPFPSMTQVCYSDVLHCPPLRRHLRPVLRPAHAGEAGRQWDRIWGHELPYERRLTYRADFLGQALAYLEPDDWYEAELERPAGRWSESPDRVTIAYIGSASSMVCKYGKPGAERVLDGARQLCLQLLYERRGAIKISMMADHGHNYTPSKNVPLEQYLTEAGFHPADRIHEPERLRRGHQRPGDLRRRPHAPARGRGQGAVRRTRRSSWRSTSRATAPILRTARGAAAVECRRGRLRYVPLDADVLGYGPVIERLKAEGKMDADGYAGDEAWFRRHPRPTLAQRPPAGVGRPARQVHQPAGRDALAQGRLLRRQPRLREIH